jgi:hypothetical protein
VCDTIAARHGIEVLDVDERLYGRWHGAIDARRHPALAAWSGTADPLAWQLALEPGAFLSFHAALTAEGLDLLARELHGRDAGAPLLVDGGFGSVAVLAQSLGRIACCPGAGAPRRLDRRLNGSRSRRRRQRHRRAADRAVPRARRRLSVRWPPKPPQPGSRCSSATRRTVDALAAAVAHLGIHGGRRRGSGGSARRAQSAHGRGGHGQRGHRPAVLSAVGATSPPRRRCGTRWSAVAQSGER